MSANFDKNDNPFERRSQESLIDAAWDMIRKDQGLSHDTRYSFSGNSEAGYHLRWEVSSKNKSDFESAQFQIDSTDSSVFIHLKSPGEADLRFVRKGELTLSQFISSLIIERSTCDSAQPTTLKDLSMAYVQRRSLLRDEVKNLDPMEDEAGSLDPMEKIEEHFNFAVIPPTLEFPEGALLSDDQKLLLVEMMHVGSDLLNASEYKLSSEEAYDPSCEKEFEKVIDEAHVSFELACQDEITYEMRERLETIRAQLLSFLELDGEYEDIPKVARDEFEIVLALAKTRAVLEYIPMRVRASEKADNTWSDFAVSSIDETIADEESIRYIVKLPRNDQ